MKKKIVIVDDDIAIHEIYQMIFEREGLNAVTLANPRPLFCLEHLDADIFLIDKEMPGTDGLDVCRFLKRTPSTQLKPVIIISACPNLTQACLQAGAAGFVEKPFNIKQLVHTIATNIVYNHNSHSVHRRHHR